MNRRRFLWAILAGAGAAVTTISWVSRDRLRTYVQQLPMVRRAREFIFELDKTATGTPSAILLEDVYAVAESVLPSQPQLQLRIDIAERMTIRAEIERGYLSAVSEGVRFLQMHISGGAGRPLRNIPIATRGLLLERYLRDARSQTRYWGTLKAIILPSSRHEIRGLAMARQYVYEEILRSLFMSDEGWNAIGYSRSPWDCDGAFAYTENA